MKKRKYIWMILLFVTVAAFAGRRGTIRLDGRPAMELIEAIEGQTGLRVLGDPAVLDSLTVTVDVRDAEPEQVLRDALRSASLFVTRYSNDLIVTSEEELTASLPEGYFNAIVVREVEDAVSYLSLRREQRASSENKVYEIGSPTGQVEEWVTLVGTITNFKTGELLKGVSLQIDDPAIGVTSDASGHYSIRLPAGRRDLRIRSIGLKDTKRQVMLYASGKLDIKLEEQVYALSEVSVSANIVENVRSTALGVTRLKMKEIKNIPTAFGELDILKVVMALPGVKSVGEVSSGFNVRGGATDQNLILFNGGTVYNPTHLFGLFSIFNSDMVKDMELYKSSIPAKFGGRISSVLDINSREGSKEKFQGSASLGLLTSSLTLEGPLFNKKTSYIVGARTTYSDWLLNLLPEKSGYKDGNAGFYDLNASIDHRFDVNNSLTLTGYFSHDRFHFDEVERYAYQNASASLKWTHAFHPNLTGTFITGYDHYNNRTENTDNPATAYTLTFGIDQFYGKADFSWQAHDHHTIGFGLSSLYYNLNPGEYLGKGEASLVLDDRMQSEKALESAIYVGDRWDITPTLSIDAGIRYSMYNVMGPRTYNLYEPDKMPTPSAVIDTKEEGSGVYKTYQGPEFRISARYEFADGFSIKAGYNTMRQNIHKLSNTTIMSPTDTWKLSDANIKSQTGSQVAVGLYKNFIRAGLETSVEGYYKTMDNYLDYRNGANLIMNHHIETDVVNTKGRAYGVEFMIRKPNGKLNGWVSYTYSRTQLRQEDARIKKPVNRGEWYPADYDKPHDLKFVGNYKFTQRFSVSVNCDYSTGRPVSIPVSKYNFAGGEFVYFSDRNQYRIPDYFRMDLSINIEPSHHLTLLTHSTVSLGIYNVTGRDNAYSVYYVAEEGRLKGYKLAIFGAPIPYISYNIKF